MGYSLSNESSSSASAGGLNTVGFEFAPQNGAGSAFNTQTLIVVGALVLIALLILRK